MKLESRPAEGTRLELELPVGDVSEPVDDGLKDTLEATLLTRNTEVGHG